MKRLLTLLPFSLAALGCVQQSGAPVSQALPLAEDVRVNLPEDAGEAQAALGEVSEYYALTRGISREFNAGAGFVLVLVHTIVQFPATEVNGNEYVWGPFSDALDPAEYRLTVVDNGNQTYDWKIDGRSKFDEGSEFLTAISGFAVEGSEPHRGSGDFTMDFDVMKTLDPIEHADSNGGSVTVAYDLENRDGTQASLDMHIEAPFEEGGTELLVADYRYAENQDRSGDFQFSVPLDVNEDGSALEDVILRSRWLADGSGRTDARVSGGDAGEEIIEVSQCWDTTFRTVYEVATHDIIQEAGDTTACAFADQDLPDL